MLLTLLLCIHNIYSYAIVIGEQEFRGRNKKNTLAVKEKAQARRSSKGTQVSIH